MSNDQWLSKKYHGSAMANLFENQPLAYRRKKWRWRLMHPLHAN